MKIIESLEKSKKLLKIYWWVEREAKLCKSIINQKMSVSMESKLIHQIKLFKIKLILWKESKISRVGSS